jgi:NTE family protein
MVDAPIRLPIQDDDAGEGDHLPERGIALCMSGGGYRAMVFHIGALWRLNEAGLLRKLARVSSVSGGSIAAGYLGLMWTGLKFDERGVATNFESVYVHGLREFAGRTVDVGAILGGISWFGTIGEKVSRQYAKSLFGDATLQDLPSTPRFVINATNLQSGRLWRFSKPYMGDYRVGRVVHPKVRLADAVAASSAFPPVLSPFTLTLDPASFEPRSGHDLGRRPFTETVVLSDGGVYDNLGLETAFKRYDTLLVSDGGGAMADEEKPHSDWLLQSKRVLDVIDTQVRALRKRQLLDAFEARARLAAAGADPDSAEVRRFSRAGAYWGIRTDIDAYGLPDALPAPIDRTMELARIPTRLEAMDAYVFDRLVNWGYGVCDAALRRHLDPTIDAPKGHPYPGGVG